MVGFRMLTHVIRRNVVCDEFLHSLEVETTLDHTDGPVYPPVTRDGGVVVGCDDFLDAVLRDNDFVVCPQSAVLEVLTLVVLEIPCGWVEKLREDLGVMYVVFHSVFKDSSCWVNAGTSKIQDPAIAQRSSRSCGCAVLHDPLLLPLGAKFHTTESSGE